MRGLIGRIIVYLSTVAMIGYLFGKEIRLFTIFQMAFVILLFLIVSLFLMKDE